MSGERIEPQFISPAEYRRRQRIKARADAMERDEPQFDCPGCGEPMLGGSWCRSCVRRGVPDAADEPQSISEPLDQLHRECIEARWAVRAHAKILQSFAADWQPKECPQA